MHRLPAACGAWGPSPPPGAVRERRSGCGAEVVASGSPVLEKELRRKSGHFFLLNRGVWTASAF
eukprot:9479825-Pyramimonas_sp.AAC.1